MIRLICLFITGMLLQAQPRFDEGLTGALRYRNLGPFRAGGWVSDIAVPETPQKAHMDTVYVGVRNGGVWKTTNAGVTWEPIFDQQDVMSIGAVAVSPKDPETVWVGTGDAYFARSPHHGNGVYKSTNGGRTWEHLGLEDTQHIAKILIDPLDPNVVYVAATGHAYTPNAERGIFKTTDGGKTWTKSLYVDDHSAAIDLLIDNKNPKVLYAAMWYRPLRRPTDPPVAPPAPGAPVPDWGGIYKTIDAGRNWQKIEGGLPKGRLGRIGLALYVKDPRIVYAIVDNQNRRPLTEAEKARTAQVPQRPGAGGDQGRQAAMNERTTGSEIYRTDDSGRTWRKMNAVEDDPGSKAPGTFTMIRVDTENPDRIYSLTSDMMYSNDGGKTWPGLQRPQMGGGQAGGGFARSEQPMWSSRPNRPGVLLANSFGDYRTLWIDPQNSKRWLIGSDGGVFASWDGGETASHFANLPLGEINGIVVDNDNPYNFYVGEQDHEHWKGPVNSWSGGIGPDEWITVGTSDGEMLQVDPTDSRWLYTTSENGQHARLDQKTYTQKRIAPQRPQGQPPLRFAWTAPIRLSPHDPAVLYTGAQLVLRSMDRGDHWQEISPDLTVDPNAPPAPAPARGGNIATLCESAATPGVIWVGTSNGRVHVTRDAGQSWKDVTANIPAPGAPIESAVTRVTASKFQAGTAYVAKSKYNLDDATPLLFKTTDYGATWESIAGNLPQCAVNVILEDTVNPNLLFAGTDGGAYASLDGGKRWVSIRGNMPAVSVMDMVLQPRESELALGSYGRGIWVTNIAPLREMTEENLAKDAHFFAVRPEGAREQRALGNYRFHGFNNLVTPNEPSGLKAFFYLREEPKEQVLLTVSDVAGAEIRSLKATVKQGLNRVVWDLRDAKRQQVQPGEYLMTLQTAGQKLTQKVRVLEPVVVAP